MGIKFVIAILAGSVAIGLSIWGLFNKNRSILCAATSVVLILGASLGALHAWGEGRSIPWTTAYSIIVLAGIASLLRQILPRKQTKTGE